jgi:hypothetical protein
MQAPVKMQTLRILSECSVANNSINPRIHSRQLHYVMMGVKSCEVMS